MAKSSKKISSAKPFLFFTAAFIVCALLLRLEFIVANHYGAALAGVIDIVITLVGIVVLYLSLKAAMKTHAKNWQTVNALAMSVAVAWLMLIITGFILSLFLGPSWDGILKELSF